MPSALSHVRFESSAASSTSLTLCLDICAARAIAFCDRPDARSLRASLALILLAMLYPLGSRLHGQPERIREAVPMGILLFGTAVSAGRF